MNTPNDNNPTKAYSDEQHGRGSTFTDTNEEAAARDQAKMDKVASGETQKMDGGNPDADEDSVSDEEIRRETLQKK